MAHKNAANSIYNTHTEAETAVKSLQKGGFDMKKLSILVVDDNPNIVPLVKIILEGNGYGVQTAYNGPEVFSRLEEQKPDPIILDVMMPQMDGLEVLRQLKGNTDYYSLCQSSQRGLLPPVP